MGIRFMTYVLAAVAIVAVAVLAGCATGNTSTGSIAERYPPTGDFVEVNGTRLHYELTGPEGAPTVLVLHGASGNLHEPKLALDDVLADYRVLWIDRPGLGWSERPRGGDWHPGREAALITDMMTALEIDQAHVIGHSWGGAIATRLLMDHPERITSGVLVAPALRANVGDAAFYNHVTGWPVIGTLMTRVVVPNVGPGSLQGGTESAFAPVEPPEGYVEDVRLPLILRPGPWRANAHDMARVNESLAEQEGRYDTIAQPVIVIAAEGDTVLLTDRHSVPFVDTAQNAELRMIDGEGHNLHHAHSDAVAAALAEVMARAE